MIHPTEQRAGLRAGSFAILLAGLLCAGRARAYCLASTCDADGAVCEPPQITDCGMPLRWHRSCVGFAVQRDASVQVPRATAQNVVRQAFDAWEQASCEGGAPGIHVEDMQSVECDRVEYNQTAANANVIVFRDEAWTHPDDPHNIALTTVTFDTKTGEIVDADIEVNTAQYKLTTTDTTADYDLLAVLTHEAGHFLGLAHSAQPEATMFASYSREAGTLDPDDAQAICRVYPPAAISACNPIPRHGFSTSCAGAQTEGDCSAAPLKPTPGGAAAIAALALGAALKRIRRSRRKGRRSRARRQSC